MQLKMSKPTNKQTNEMANERKERGESKRKGKTENVCVFSLLVHDMLFLVVWF